MSSVGMIEKTDRAIKSITKGKDKKGDALLMMAPFANWDRFLTPAPSAIAILGELLLISTATDFTLTEKMPTGGFKYIKYPDSFRTCLVQVSNGGWNAFNEAHTSMDQIHRMLGNVDSHIKDSVRILMAGSAKEVEEILPSSLRNIQEIADNSLNLAKNIEEKFLFVMNLTEELLEASTNTKSVYDGKAKDTATLQHNAELDKERALDATKERKKRYANITEQVTRAQDQFTKAVEGMPTSGDVLMLSLAEGMVDSIKSVVGLSGDIVKGLREEPLSMTRDWLQGACKQKTKEKVTVEKTYNVQMAEHNVLNTVPMIHANIQSLQEMLGCPDQTPNLKVIKDNIGTLKTSLSSNLERVLEEKNAGEIGNRISTLCNKARDICLEADKISNALTTDRSIVGLQAKVAEIVTESMALLAKTNKRSGKNPLEEKSPCLQKMQTQSENTNIIKTAMDAARFKTELAKETLKDVKDRQDPADKQLEEANERLTEILKSMATLEIKSIDFDTVRKTLKQGIAALAQVRVQWGKLVIFFEEISNIIKCCMHTSLKKFVQTVTTSRTLKGKGEMMSNAFRANMYEQTLHASRVSYIVSTMAGAYVEISTENIMEQISSLADLIGLDPEDDKHRIVLERTRLHEKCEAAQIAIRKKIKEQHLQYEIEADKRISRIQREVEAIMPPLDNLPAIQRAVKEGFKEDMTVEWARNLQIEEAELEDIVG